MPPFIFFLDTPNQSTNNLGGTVETFSMDPVDRLAIQANGTYGSDNTIRGIPRGFQHIADFWIPWSDIEPVAFGWDYARAHLPAEVVALLSACDGTDHLALNRQIKNEIFDSLPDWRERVMEVLATSDSETL